MPNLLGATAKDDLGFLFSRGTLAGLSDQHLLDRFALRYEDPDSSAEEAETAFETLIARHGPIVWRICRRGLTDLGDAEDAFQATFLVLARRCRDVRVDDSLGRWLSGVARRVVARARVYRRRLYHREKEIDIAALLQLAECRIETDRAELRDEIDQALMQIPESYRTAIQLCLVKGLSHAEAAKQLGCPIGTVSSHVSRGCALLRSRLSKRGLFSSIPLFPLVGNTRRAPVELPPPAVVKAAVRCATRGLSPGIVSAHTLQLAEGVLNVMNLANSGRLAPLAILSLVTIAGGLAFAQSESLRSQPDERTQGLSAAQEVLEAQRQWGEATLHGDRALVDRILHTDMAGTAATDMGPFWGKKELLERIHPGAHPEKAHYELSETRVRVYGDAAIITGCATVRSPTESSIPPQTSRFTSTYIRKGGRWQCVAFQSLETTAAGNARRVR